MSVKFTVAIDGPAAAGKGTIAKGIAAHFGFAHLDTGLLYRAVGRRVLAGDDPVAAANSLTTIELMGDELRTPAVAQSASKIAEIKGVRSALLTFQRDFAAQDGGAVLDGRDISTVICPDADVKLFVTASDDVRAERRLAELVNKGIDTTLAQVLNDLRSRDTRDAERNIAPTKMAQDALLIDTSDMSIKTALASAIDAVNLACRRETS